MKTNHFIIIAIILFLLWLNSTNRIVMLKALLKMDGTPKTSKDDKQGTNPNGVNQNGK